MTTCECGLTYVPGVPEDDKAHAKIHNEYLHGAKLQEIELAKVVGTVASYPLVVVSVMTRLRNDYKLTVVSS